MGNALRSVGNGLRHVACAAPQRGGLAGLALLPMHMFLSCVAVLSYSRGLYCGCTPRTPGHKSFIVNAKPVTKRRAESCVVIPTLTTTAEQYAKLEAATQSVVSAGGTLVLVDDGSPLNLSPLADNESVILVRHAANYGPGAARNTGARVAMELFSPQFIAFTDSDCRVRSDWLYQHSKYQSEQPGIWSGQTAALGTGLISRYHDIMGTLNGRFRSANSLLYGPSCNMSVDTKLLGFHGFDEHFPGAAFEDVEFCVRMTKTGIPTRYAETAVVLHDYSESLIGFANQFFRYGSAHPLMLRAHPEYNRLFDSTVEIPAIPMELNFKQKNSMFGFKDK